MNERKVLNEGIESETAGLSSNEPPWPPLANRETRRKCTRNGHDRFKTINGITACIHCGTEVK
jgi:hypothetical protein